MLNQSCIFKNIFLYNYTFLYMFHLLSMQKYGRKKCMRYIWLHKCIIMSNQYIDCLLVYERQVGIIPDRDRKIGISSVKAYYLFLDWASVVDQREIDSIVAIELTRTN